MNTPIKPIKSASDYKAALQDSWDLMQDNPSQGTAAGDRLDILVTLIEVYENKYHTIAAPNPVDFLKGFLDLKGLKPVDLQPMLGSKSKVSEVLGRKRKLSISMIRKLVDAFDMPAEVLIQPYTLTGETTQVVNTLRPTAKPNKPPSRKARAKKASRTQPSSRNKKGNKTV